MTQFWCAAHRNPREGVVMPRPKSAPRPFWRGREQSWYAKVGGRTLSLRVTDPGARRAAVDALKKLLQDLEPDQRAIKDTQGQIKDTVADAAAAFLAHAARRHQAGRLSAGCLRNYRLFVAPLAADLGGRQLASLTADDLEGWAARPGWSPSTQHNALGVVLSILRRERVQLDRPLERPPMQSRGPDSALSPEQFELVLKNLYLKGGKARGDLRELLLFLRNTGWRPGEAAGLTAAVIDWQAGTVRLDKHKRRHKTGRPDVRAVGSAALQILRAQADRYPTGPLFRTRTGGKAYGANVVVKQLLKVSERVGFRVTAYMLRHTFVTDALAAGVPEAVVAALVGTSVQMIHKHYGHVGSRIDVLRAAAEKATGRQAG